MTAIRDPRSDLRFLLPLVPGERALFPGKERVLAAAVAATGLEVTCSSGLPWSPPSNSVDHVLLPFPTGDLAPQVAEAGRVLRPGGYLLLGLVNGCSLYRRSARTGSGAPPALTLWQARRLLQRQHFQLRSCYGVRDSLQAPDLLVPLETPEPSDFYFGTRFTPYTQRGAALGRLAPWLTALGAHTLLYPALLLVARRAPV